MNQLSLISLQDETPLPQQVEGESVWGCDYGSGYIHLHRNGINKRLTPAEFATLSFAAAGDVVVIENAHMQPKKRSLAQIYTIEELLSIKEVSIRRGVEIRLWFHSQTPKWRSKLNHGDKSDAVDALTIADIAKHRGIADMQHFDPRAEYPPRIRWAHEQINDMNRILNIARIDYQADTCPAVSIYQNTARYGTLHQLWQQHGAHSAICTDCNRFFYGKDSRGGISLWAAVVDWDGNPRSYNGAQPGVKFIMNELLRMKPNHFKGGVSRSNLMFWGFRNLAIEHMGNRVGGKIAKRLHEFTPEQHAKWLRYRQRYRRAMVVTLHAMKAYVNQ